MDINPVFCRGAYGGLQMVRDHAAAETALLRYYNGSSRKKTGKAELSPLGEALAMVKAGFNVESNPFLQVHRLGALHRSCLLSGVSYRKMHIIRVRGGWGMETIFTDIDLHVLATRYLTAAFSYISF